MPRRPRSLPGTVAGDVVVVTGASRGIGAEMCRRFSAIGAQVGLIARDAAAMDVVRGTMTSPACAVVADVTDATALRSALDEIIAALGPVTVLVNNAGQGGWDAAVETEDDVYRRLMEVNFLATVNATRHVLPSMLERRRGHIINVVSIAGRIGAPFESAYSASKFAVTGFSESLAIELAGTGIDVSMIHPGPVATQFADSRRRAAPRRAPRPVPVAAVADAVMATVHHPRLNRYMPPWLGLAVAARTMLPAAYRIATERMYAADRRTLRERFERSDRLDKGR